MLDRIPERLRTAAEGVAKATQMMAEAKSARNQAASDVGACYGGIPKEHTVEWQAADEIERLHKWVYATARSLERSGLTLEEYNQITADVIAAFEQSR